MKRVENFYGDNSDKIIIIWSFLYWMLIIIINIVGVVVFIIYDKADLLPISLGACVAKIFSCMLICLGISGIEYYAHLKSIKYSKSIEYPIMHLTLLHIDYIIGYIILYYYGIWALFAFFMEIEIISLGLIVALITLSIYTCINALKYAIS